MNERPKRQGPAPDPIGVGKQCAALHSRVFSRLITRHYNAYLADSGLRITQFTVLNAIKARPPESIHQLAELLGMERTSLQRTVDKLVELGLVETTPTGKRRALGLALTAAGESCYRQALEAWQQAHAAFTDLVGATDWERTARDLRRLSSQTRRLL